MSDKAATNVKCALCGVEKDNGLRFCSACADRALESVRTMMELNGPPPLKGATAVAITYLYWLYEGSPGDPDLDLVMLAVTASSEIRSSRIKIAELRQEISDLRNSRFEMQGQSFADRDLASLVNLHTESRKTERIDQIVVDHLGQGEATAKPEAPPKTSDLVPILRAMTEATPAHDPRALNNTAYCPPILNFTASPGKSAKYVRADLALQAAEEDVRRAIQIGKALL